MSIFCAWLGHCFTERRAGWNSPAVLVCLHCGKRVKL